MTNTTSQYPDTLHHDDGSHRNTSPEVTDPGIFEEMKRRHLREHIDQDNAVWALYKQLAATLTQLAQAGETIKVIDRDLNPLTLPDGSPLIVGSREAFILQGATGGISYYEDLKAWDCGSDGIQGLPKTATVTWEHLTSLAALTGPRGRFRILPDL